MLKYLKNLYRKEKNSVFCFQTKKPSIVFFNLTLNYRKASWANIFRSLYIPTLRSLYKRRQFLESKKSIELLKGKTPSELAQITALLRPGRIDNE